MQGRLDNTVSLRAMKARRFGVLWTRVLAEPRFFIEPCLPSPADKPPSGSHWIHEIKHDG